MAAEVPESSGADSFSDGSGRLMRSWRVLVQIADEVPESSGADSQKPSKIFQVVGDNALVYFLSTHLSTKRQSHFYVYRIGLVV